MPSDPELLRRYAEDASEPAFTELVQRYVNLVYVSALRRTGGSAHLAADVTQQVFTELGKNAALLSRHTMLIGWLYTATRYASAKVLRAEQRRKFYERAAMASAGEAVQPTRWENLRPVIDRMLDSLHREDREILLQRYFATQTFREVGLSMGITKEAARKRADRALEKLRQVAGKFGIHSTESALGLLLESNLVVATAPALAAAVAAKVFATSATPTHWTGALFFMGNAKIFYRLRSRAVDQGGG